MKQMLDAEYLWPPMNEQWSLHSSDQNGLLHRIGALIYRISCIDPPR
jgi:hypothetical protein